VQLAGASLQIIDNTATVQRVNSTIASVVGQVAAAFYDPYFSVPNPGPVGLALPATTAWLFYVRNISGSNNISIILTPAGGAAWASAYVLVPNGIFLTMATFSTNPGSGGFTAATLGASGAGTFAEVLVAA
jgi:hypothetical protein